jgi:hypothetical protein
MDDILSLYKIYNRPGARKLSLLAKLEGMQTTLENVQAFIASRTEEQQLNGYYTRHLKVFSSSGLYEFNKINHWL